MIKTGNRLLIMLCALVCGWMLPGEGQAATEWQNLLTEDFSQGEVSFYTGQASEAFYGIDDENRYVIDGLNTEIDSLSALTKNLYYYYVESECELIDTRIGEMAFCGLVFHYNKKIPGKLAYYVFYIYADGYYGAKRVIGDNAEVILPLTRSEYIDIDRPNLLAVDARGTRFDLYINGRYVDGFTDVRIDGGGFGFYVSQQARAAFDNFSVKVERRGGGPAEVEGPELLEGSSDDTARSSVSRGENFGGYNFPEIPKDPNRPVYPWEVGVDKSETARKERDRARENELADLARRRLQEELTEPVLNDVPAQVEEVVEEAAPVQEDPPPRQDPDPVEQQQTEQEEPQDNTAGVAAEQPAADEAELTTHSYGDPQQPAEVEEVTEQPAQDSAQPAGGAQIPDLDLAATQPPADQQEVEAVEEAAGEVPADDAAAEQQEVQPVDETFTNVSLPDQENPPVAAGEQAADNPADEERSAEEIMEEVRNSSGDDWSTDAPPYIPPDEARTNSNDEQEAPAEVQEEVEATAANDDSLKGIELPSLDLAQQSRPPAAVEEESPEVPVDDNQTELATEDEPAEESDGLSLFPDAGTDERTPSAGPDPDPAKVLGQPTDNPGELKLIGGQTANDASREYDPFEGNPDVETVYDDFTEQRWPVADGETSSYRYFGAAYEIDNTNSDTMAISYQQGSFTDARYGLDVEYLGGLDYVGYGLATRFTVKNGNVSYYGMFVSQSGEVLLLKVLDGKEVVLRDWTAAAALSRTLSNRIGMELIGNSISCIVNGEVVATVTDDSLRGGGYALLCGPGTSTRFDNLTIKGLTAGDD